MPRLLLTLLSLMFFLQQSAFAENWPQFRGPEFNARPESSFPKTWDESTNIAWSIPNPGEGWSCPIVWNNKLFLTAAVLVEQAENQPQDPGAQEQLRRGGNSVDLTSASYRWELQCLNARSGALDWKIDLKQGHPPLERHSQNTYATETPVTDGEFVFAYFGMIGLYCCDMAGNLIWEKDLGNYPMRAGWGTSSSPVLYQNLLIIQVDNEEQSFVVALDKLTGTERWRVLREEPSQYSSPIIWKNSLRSELIVGGTFCRSYDPMTGELLWQLDMKKGRSCATPVTQGDILYVGNELRNRGGDDDGGGFLYAVKAGGKGEITPSDGNSDSEFILWTCPKSGIQMASPVLCQGQIYLFERNGGIVHVVDQKTGTMTYEKRIPGARAFWSSPWVSGEFVYALDDTGTTHVIKGGPTLDIVTTNSLSGQFWSTASIANNSLYLRSTDRLYCISEEK